MYITVLFNGAVSVVWISHQLGSFELELCQKFASRVFG